MKIEWPDFLKRPVNLYTVARLYVHVPQEPDPEKIPQTKIASAPKQIKHSRVQRTLNRILNLR